jgi:hypothetical protein
LCRWSRGYIPIRSTSDQFESITIEKKGASVPVREVEIIVRGRRGGDAHDAAHAVAQVLEEAGASVDLKSPVVHGDLPRGVLRGLRVEMNVEGGGGGSKIASSFASSNGNATGETNLTTLAKVGVGVVLLLMLFGAELRLRFGVRLDTIITIAGIWAFWHYCLRPRKTTG